MAESKQSPRRKRRVKHLDKGVIYIQSSFNNTILSLTDETGNVIQQASAGSSGFSGTKKSTPYAASQATYRLLDVMRELGLREARLEVRGVGPGREAAIRAIANAGIEISRLRDVTPIAHNGPRPRKARRV